MELSTEHATMADEIGLENRPSIFYVIIIRASEDYSWLLP
jgi:hypothetical protein